MIDGQYGANRGRMNKDHSSAENPHGQLELLLLFSSPIPSFLIPNCLSLTHFFIELSISSPETTISAKFFVAFPNILSWYILLREFTKILAVSFLSTGVALEMQNPSTFRRTP